MDIKQLAERYSKICKTNNPFAIAKHLDIDVRFEPLGQILGFYDAHFRCGAIHINQSVPHQLKQYVCAHELGHAIMHKQVNTPFLRTHTFFSIDAIEVEANTFAVELLLPDSYLREHSDTGIECLANCRGVPIELVKLKTAPIKKPYHHSIMAYNFNH